MRIEHVAIWTKDLERLKSFYETYFEGRAGETYRNPAKGFESIWLTFPSGGARLELMRSATYAAGGAGGDAGLGYAHLALSVGSEERVVALTERLKKDGFRVLDGPRTTGDGYFESVVLDPEGNRVEITV
jgi:lactoylglutathione lyase